MTDLPEGWTTCELGACVDVLDNLRVPVNSDERSRRQGKVPYYGATGQVGWIDDCLFDEELLLIGEDGAPFLDKSKSIAYIIKGKSWVNNHAHVLRAREGVSINTYLKHFLDQFDFQEYVNGTTRLKLTQGALNRIPMRLAPLNEQRRIVARLEELLAKLEACQKRLAKVPVIIKRFRQSVLTAACSSRLTEDWRDQNSDSDHTDTILERGKREGDEDAWAPADLPESWLATRLDELCVKITDGDHLTPPSSANGIPLLSAKDVRDGFLDFSETKFVSNEVAAKSRLRCDPENGDILVVSRGATVGRTCRVQTDQVFCLMGSVLLFKPDKNVVTPHLIEYCFKSPKGLAALIARSGATAQQAIYIRDMRSFPIPLPPLGEQKEIVRRIEGLFKIADQIEQRYKSAQAQIDKLTQSILAKAFRGELIPTEAELASREGRDFEPASTLLDRLLKDRAQPAGRTKARRVARER